MKKFLSVLLAAVIICLSAVPCFALFNGRHYKLVLPKDFSETETGDGYAIWENKETGSKVKILMEENPKRLYYIDADEETQKEFSKSFIEERQNEAYKDSDANGYSLKYGEEKFSEIEFEYVKGFSITAETTRTSLDGGKTEVFDSDFYFFSTKDIIVQFRCELMTDEDKAQMKASMNAFQLDSELLTAENYGESYPSPLILLVPLAIIVLIVVIVIVVRKKKNGASKTEEKTA